MATIKVGLVGFFLRILSSKDAAKETFMISKCKILSKDFFLRLLLITFQDNQGFDSLLNDIKGNYSLSE